MMHFSDGSTFLDCYQVFMINKRFMYVTFWLCVVMVIIGMPAVSIAELTYTLSGSIPAEKLDAITAAMDGCCYYYNLYSDYDKDVWVYYSASIPTAQASLNGPIGFGGSISTKTAIHEMGHVMGVGVYWNWDPKVSGGGWQGANGKETLRRLDGEASWLGADGSHFWPYGFNYNWENPKKHVLLVGAMRYDMGMKNKTKDEYNVLITTPQSFVYEAEWAATQENFSPFSVVVDAASSGGEYVEWIGNGTQSNPSPSDSDTGLLQFNFNLSEQCDVQLRARVNFPDNAANLFYFKMDDGSWLSTKVKPTTGFAEVALRTYFDLAAGHHTISILRGEDGSQIDNIVISPMNYHNTALFKPVTVDSVNGSYVGSNAVDGDFGGNSSRWVSANTPWPHWIEVDLQGDYDISHMRFWTGYDGYNNALSDFKFQRWDGSDWVDILSEVGNTKARYTKGFPTVTTSKVRLYATNGPDNYVRMYEIKVYGVPTPPADTTAPTAPARLRGVSLIGGIHLNWSDSAESDLMYYSVYRSTTPGSGYALLADFVATSNFTDKNVIEGTTYYYTVSATDTSFNESGDSSEVTVTSSNVTTANVALNKLVAVDSVNGSSAGSNAVDGDNSSDSSRWVSANTAWPHWIEVDLQGHYLINELKYWTGYQGYSRPITDFQFQRWDGNNWIDIFVVDGNSDPAYSRTFVPVTTSKVRLYGTAATDNYFRLFEIEVYGTEGYAGDLNYDNKLDMKDIADLSGGWQSSYGIDDLQNIAADWLSGVEF